MGCGPLDRRRCSPVTLLGNATEPNVGLAGRRLDVVDEEDLPPGLAVRFSQPPRYRGAAGAEEPVTGAAERADAEKVGAIGGSAALKDVAEIAEDFTLSGAETSREDFTYSDWRVADDPGTRPDFGAFVISTTGLGLSSLRP